MPILCPLEGFLRIIVSAKTKFHILNYSPVILQHMFSGSCYTLRCVSMWARAYVRAHALRVTKLLKDYKCGNGNWVVNYRIIISVESGAAQILSKSCPINVLYNAQVKTIHCLDDRCIVLHSIPHHMLRQPSWLF